VLVGGAVAATAARLVSPAEPITLTGDRPRFASRGGEKLAAALEHFGVDVAGRRALDAGASTGGFTDCLLQAGAAEVVAVDVGYGQLLERLRTDDRVVVLERTNVRYLDLAAVGGRPVDIVVADLSFISLRTVFGVLLGDVVTPEGVVVALVKPQFEAGRAEAGRGRGVIRDPSVWRRVLDEVSFALADHGAVMMDVMVSPLRGADGNVEFLACIRPHAGDAPGLTKAAFDAVVAQAAGDAEPGEA
jgi:23S rRNA (cytidine1920-2'-O)/16S rRNA (cytidine1409-2'-O)-methyltransferase